MDIFVSNIILVNLMMVSMEIVMKKNLFFWFKDKFEFVFVSK